MLGKVRKWLRGAERTFQNEAQRRAASGLSPCPMCWYHAPPNCLACRGELSETVRKSNIEAFLRRRAFADREVTAVIGHLRYASPAVREDFRRLVAGILASDFAAANRGKWQGSAALGVSAGMAVGSFLGE